MSQVLEAMAIVGTITYGTPWTEFQLSHVASTPRWAPESVASTQVGELVALSLGLSDVFPGGHSRFLAGVETLIVLIWGKGRSTEGHLN